MLLWFYGIFQFNNHDVHKGFHLCWPFTLHKRLLVQFLLFSLRISALSFSEETTTIFHTKWNWISTSTTKKESLYDECPLESCKMPKIAVFSILSSMCPKLNWKTHDKVNIIFMRCVFVISTLVSLDHSLKFELNWFVKK